MRYVAGQLLNFLEQARAITLSPGVDAIFPTSRLYDGYSDAVCRMSANAANPSVVVDLAMLDANGADNGNLDTWSGGLPTSWTIVTTGTGAVTQEAVLVRSGSAMKLVKGTGTAKGIKTYRVRSGQRLTFELYARLVSAGGVGSFQLYNPVTKKYWTGAAWQTAQAYWSTEGGTAYAQKTTEVTVEDFVANQAAITYLELTCDDTSTNGLLVEDVYVWPTWNAIVVAGHNIEPGMVTEARSSTDNFGASNVLEATMTVRRPSFYSYLSTPSTKRWAKLALTGTQSAQGGAVYISELAVTYMETATVGPSDGMKVKYIPDQVRNSSQSGVVRAQKQSDERRALQMTFDRVDPIYTTEAQEARDEILRRADFGVWPIIIAPLNALTDLVVHGRVTNAWEIVLLFNSVWQDDIYIEENPFGRVTS
jgi:hypothetical protein